MEYKVVNKTYVKSHNSVNKIYLNYTYSLIGLIFLICLLFLLFGYQDLIIPLLKSIMITTILASIIGYILNVLKKEYHFLDIYKHDYVHIIGIIIGLCGINTNLLVIALAVLISLTIKKYVKGINISSALYGILIILLYRYFTDDLITPLINFKEIDTFATNELFLIKEKDIIPYLIGTKYISPIVSVFAFIYLFYKKSIKYSIVIPYLATFSFIMFTYGIVNNMSFWFVLFQISCGNILFYMVYLLTDYTATPSIKEGQIFYGMILGIISAVLRFIIPEFAIVVALILGELILANYFDKISYKFKYSKKLYNIFIFVGFIIIVGISIGVSILFKI